jgi:hypothetical protein
MWSVTGREDGVGDPRCVLIEARSLISVGMCCADVYLGCFPRCAVNVL